MLLKQGRLAAALLLFVSLGLDALRVGSSKAKHSHGLLIPREHDGAITVAAGTATAASLSPSSGALPQSSAEFANVVVQSFTLMSSAQMFDRSWFMTLICSLKHGWAVAFIGSVLALSLHAVLAVLFGAMVAGMLPKLVLELLSAVLFGGFAAMYTWNACHAEEDGFQVARAEAQEEVIDGQVDAPARGGNKDKKTRKRVGLGPLAAVFVALFIAEWGDRTQIVMIGLSASLPAVPVLLGAFAALFLLCLSAVLFAGVLGGMHISERLVNGLCALSFGVIATLALGAAVREGLKQ